MTGMPGYPCPVCKRAGGEVTISQRGETLHHTCSAKCARILLQSKSLDFNEEKAVAVGGKVGGAYLEQIGKFDLRELSQSEWAEFCGKIFQGTCEELQRIADDEIPF
mgnify:CR=1 FL=1